jgi:hypothetical protein
LFIDEIHTLVGAGKAEGSMDAGNMLKPALARDNAVGAYAATLWGVSGESQQLHKLADLSGHEGIIRRYAAAAAP